MSALQPVARDSRLSVRIDAVGAALASTIAASALPISGHGVNLPASPQVYSYVPDRGRLSPHVDIGSADTQAGKAMAKVERLDLRRWVYPAFLSGAGMVACALLATIAAGFLGAHNFELPVLMLLSLGAFVIFLSLQAVARDDRHPS